MPTDREERPAESAAQPDAPSPAQGQQAQQASRSDTTPEKVDKPAEPVDDLVSSEHTLRVGRRTLRYTATTGRVVLRQEVYEDGVFNGSRAKAQMFMTSYVLNGVRDTARRPVTFAFNGGPGSSSVWLHLGLLGPRRVVMGDVGDLLPPPYGLADNAESLLAESDLVFIDPMSTGYSRAVDGGKPGEYHGYTGDLESVGELIRLWTSRNDRWMSPKIVAGESYGTTRAASLADHLQKRYGMYLNGIVLISSVLDFSTLDFEYRNDRAHIDYLPTYAAIAHYHGKHGRKALRTVVNEATRYAELEYPRILAQGNRLSTADRTAAAARLAELTGLTPEYVDRANLRIEHWRYFTELLRDQGRVVGRLDGRFSGPGAGRLLENMEADVSHDAIVGPYAAALNHYVRGELNYRNDLHYEQISESVHPWSFKDFEGKPIDVTPRLARAMRQNPHLQVQVAYGYYDGATPFHAAVDTFAHLDLPPELLANIEHTWYEAGHMMYVHEPSRLQQSADIAAFVRRACGL